MFFPSGDQPGSKSACAPAWVICLRWEPSKLITQSEWAWTPGLYAIFPRSVDSFAAGQSRSDALVTFSRGFDEACSAEPTSTEAAKTAPQIFSRTRIVFCTRPRARARARL